MKRIIGSLHQKEKPYTDDMPYSEVWYRKSDKIRYAELRKKKANKKA